MNAISPPISDSPSVIGLSAPAWEGDIATFAKAFIAAQRAMDAIKKAAENSHFGTKYADLSKVVEAVTPAQFAAWIRAKGGTMPTPGAASDKVIPQPGADGSAAKAEENAATANATGPVENAATAAPATIQGASGNPSAAGNAGQ